MCNLIPASNELTRGRKDDDEDDDDDGNGHSDDDADHAIHFYVDGTTETDQRVEASYRNPYKSSFVSSSPHLPLSSPSSWSCNYHPLFFLHFPSLICPGFVSSQS